MIKIISKHVDEEGTLIHFEDFVFYIDIWIAPLLPFPLFLFLSTIESIIIDQWICPSSLQDYTLCV